MNDNCYFLPDAALAMPLSLPEDFFFAQDQILLTIDRDVATCVFAEQDSVAHGDVKWYAVAFFYFARPDRNYLALLRFLFCRIRNNDSFLRRLVVFHPSYKNAVVQRGNIYSHLILLGIELLNELTGSSLK